MTVLGVDVSAWQHQGGATIPWTQWYGGGFRVAYVQATQGTGVQNPYFAQDAQDARAAGFLVGAYHMCYPSLNPDPANEFAYFTAYIAGTTLDLPPMLDDEQIGSLTFAELRTWVLDWLALAGPQALHYCDQTYLSNLDALGGIPYHQWTGRPGAAALAAGDFATQYGSGPIGGSGPNADQDYFDPSILAQEETNVFDPIIVNTGSGVWLIDSDGSMYGVTPPAGSPVLGMAGADANTLSGKRAAALAKLTPVASTGVPAHTHPFTLPASSAGTTGEPVAG